MLLPDCEKAYIPPQKLTDYLLSTSHTIGKGKAKFFREFGFDESNVEFLEFGLIAIAQTEEVLTTTVSPFGTKYIIDGILMTPMEISVNVRTVWIIESGEIDPRFVTAHPRPK